MPCRGWRFLVLPLFLAAGIAVTAQQLDDNTPQAAPADLPKANPGRPTVSAPAKITPAGYFQFESGVLGASDSPAFSSQASFNEVIKFSVSNWIQLSAAASPFVHSTGSDPPANGSGDVDLGIQAVIHHGKGANPTIALGYFGRVYNGGTPDLDTGSFRQSALLLMSGKLHGFHFDTNYLFNEAVEDEVRRAQFGQALSISHPITKKFGLAGEIWHFTQPFLRSNTVGNLWALTYIMRNNLVLDTGFNRGLTTTSTRWEAFAGFTYLLPHKVPLPWH